LLVLSRLVDWSDGWFDATVAVMGIVMVVVFLVIVVVGVVVAEVVVTSCRCVVADSECC
jgi:hypothetical protein